MSIANRIVKLIEKKGVSRYQLAKLSGVPYTTLIKVLDGTTKNPQIDTLNSIAKTLDVSIEDITQPWVSEIIEGLLETYKFSYEDLAKGTSLTTEYLTSIDDLVPGPWDYESIDKVAKFLHISNIPIRAALARQEPPAYNGPSMTAEEAFADEKFYEPETIAAHHVGEDWSEEELAEIEQFKQFVKMKRQKGGQ
ncbi:Helix-turn-helix [Paenibacillus algorifonticola]|uniref:Helix-turn-helix n=1 Tax=Paenibacillus algorifonticola TaxID=684063 RepID=A0A1I1XU22_9BACL|nr:Helix-turn-helix [Paenibacillus algorifonticola]